MEIPASKWEPRLVELSVDVPAKPINIAIWDSGVDLSLYEANLWSNEAEAANGKDDDGNGFIDDLHSFGFDHDRYRHRGKSVRAHREHHRLFFCVKPVDRNWPSLECQFQAGRGVSTKSGGAYCEYELAAEPIAFRERTAIPAIVFSGTTFTG